MSSIHNMISLNKNIRMQLRVYVKMASCSVIILQLKWVLLCLKLLQWLSRQFIHYLVIYLNIVGCQRGCTVRLLTHVHCKPTHFFFHSFIATMSYPPQTSFISVMKGWADKFHVWGTPTRSPSRSNSR